MSSRWKIPSAPVLALAVFFGSVAGVCFFQAGMRSKQERADNHRLAEFARTIAGTDRVVALIWTPYPSHKSIDLVLTGEAAGQVVQAVSSGKADPGNYKNSYLVTARLFCGTNELGEIKIDDGWLFLAGGKQYRDGSCRHFSGRGDGVLRKLIADPLGLAGEAKMEKGLEK